MNKLTRQGARNLTAAMDNIASCIQQNAESLGVPLRIALDYAKRTDLVSDAIETTASENFPIVVAEVDQTPAAINDPDVPMPSEEKTAADWDPNEIAEDQSGPQEGDGDESYMKDHFTQQRFHELHDKQEAGALPMVDKFASLDTFIGTDIDAEIGMEALTKIGAGFNQIMADAANLSRMPGLSPMQLRQKIDRIAEVRQDLEIQQAQFADVLKRMKDLEKEEKAGLDELQKAAKAMTEKGKYLAETEKALLQFTAYLTDKVPGIAQMIAREDEVKPGVKAGDFFGRIAQELGDDVSEAVERIYASTKDDLTHATMAVRGFKLVVKTSSLTDETLKTAGVVDMVVALREWLSGKADSLASRLLNFVGDVSKWVKGFLVRTKIVQKESNVIKGILSSAQQNIETAFKANPLRAAHVVVAADEDDKDACDLEACDKAASIEDPCFGFNLFQ